MEYVIDIIRDVVIGLVSGGVSSWIVSYFLKKKWDKQQHQISFERDKQIYHRYIERIRFELLTAQKSGDYDFVIRTIEDEPIRESFDNLSKESSEEIRSISDYLSELKEEVSSGAIGEKRFKIINSKLFQFSVHILKMSEAE